MDPNTSLALTEKGIDEVKRRTYKLSIRKRSVLLLLETPHRVDHLLQKTVLQPEEFGSEIEGLIRDGFVHVVGGAPPAAPATAPQAAPAAPNALNLTLPYRTYANVACFGAVVGSFCLAGCGIDCGPWRPGYRAMPPMPERCRAGTRRGWA